MPTDKPRIISLRPIDIRSYAALANQLDPRALARFKALIENACVPVHLASAQAHTVGIMAATGLSGMDRVHLPETVVLTANEIVAKENQKLREQGVQGKWVDGKKLAVQAAMTKDPDVLIKVVSIQWSEILAMKGFSFDLIADFRAFKLDTNTHVLAMDNGHQVLLVGHRGRKPGEPRMGSEALLAPAKMGTQWTLATNGTVDADVLSSAKDASKVWVKNSLKEFSEELGVEGENNLRYLGLIVDTKMFIGAIGIVGVIDTHLTPYEIDEKRKKARDAVEVPMLDVIPLEQESLAAYLRINRSNMVPQLVTSIAMLGYGQFGDAFLKLADK